MNRFGINKQKIKRMPYITLIFLGIQVLVYVLMELYGLTQGIYSGSENSEILVLFGAMTPYKIVFEHQYWRFITPIFIHIGLAHLALNSLSLYFVGRILEPIIGHTRYFFVYMLSGIMGNLFSFAFGNPGSISAGASTSLFGIFAAFIILGKMIYHPLIQNMSRNMTLLIVMNLVMNLFDSGVDILGHLGGAVGGLLLMLIVGVPGHMEQFGKTMNKHKRIVAAIFFIFLAVLCSVYGYQSLLSLIGF